MAENSKIEWTDHTFNPWVGCQKVSPGCDRCYAEGWAKRSGLVQWGPHAERRRTSAANWRKPLKWARDYREQVELFNEGMLTLPPSRPRVFCASLAVVFDNQVPPEWRGDLFDMIAATPELDWLLLTKRPENLARMFPTGEWRNIWLGITAEDQELYDRRWLLLRRQDNVPVHFISYEPALGPLKLFGRAGDDGYPKGLDWIICGGESGGGHRPFDPVWAHELRMDCERARIAYFFKQMDGKRF